MDILSCKIYYTNFQYLSPLDCENKIFHTEQKKNIEVKPMIKM